MKLNVLLENKDFSEHSTNIHIRMININSKVKKSSCRNIFFSYLCVRGFCRLVKGDYTMKIGSTTSWTYSNLIFIFFHVIFI